MKREFSNSTDIIDDLILRKVGTREKKVWTLALAFFMPCTVKIDLGIIQRAETMTLPYNDRGWSEYCGVISQTSEKISAQYQFIYCAQGSASGARLDAFDTQLL